MENKKLAVNMGNFNQLKELMKNHEKYKTMLFGENGEGETVSISINEDNVVCSTLQKNGWTRKNIVHADGSSEELYEKS